MQLDHYDQPRQVNTRMALVALLRWKTARLNILDNHGLDDSIFEFFMKGNRSIGQLSKWEASLIQRHQIDAFLDTKLIN